MGQGTEHFVLVRTPTESYVPGLLDLPVMTDHGVVDPPPPPPPADKAAELAAKKDKKESKKREAADTALSSIAKRLRNQNDEPPAERIPPPKKADITRALGRVRPPRATDEIKGDAKNFMKEKPVSDTPLTFLADEVASACKWPVNSTHYASNQLDFKEAHKIVEHNMEVKTRVLTTFTQLNGKKRRGHHVDQTAYLEAELMMVITW